MGYYVKPLPWKKSVPNWKIQFVSYKKKHVSSSKAKKKSKTWDISPERWKSLGFYRMMSLEDARTRSKQLNLIESIKRQEESTQIHKSKNESLQKLFYATIPKEFSEEFEKRFVTKTFLTEDRDYNRNRALRVWRAAQKVIIAVNCDPSEWHYNVHDFYDYFCNKQLSVRYMNEIMKFVNLWGFFFCKKIGRPFMQVPRAGGYEKRRIINAYYEKTKNNKKSSDPLDAEKLKVKKGVLGDDIYNWLYLSVWFGLRPKEVDNLHNKELWRLETLFNGRVVLWVYQTKVIALPEEDRWKPIPILFSEQEEGVRILQSGVFKRPLSKTVRHHFGAHVVLYGGRKAFTDLMLSKGHSLENISIWMGHSTIERTWKSYKNRRKYHVHYAV